MRLAQRLPAAAGAGSVVLAVVSSGSTRTAGAIAAAVLLAVAIVARAVDAALHARAESRALLEVLAAAPVAVLALDREGRVREINRRAERLLGWPPEQTHGWPVWQLLAAAGEEEALRAEVQAVVAAASEGPHRVEHRIVDRAGRTFLGEATLAPTAGGAALVLADLGERDLREQLREVEHRLARRLASARSGLAVADEVLELLGAGLGFAHAELWLPDEGEARLRLVRAWRSEPTGRFATAAEGLEPARGEDLAGVAWEAGAPLFVDDVRAAQRVGRADAARADGIVAAAALPLAASGEVFGVAVLARKGGGPLEDELRRTLRSVAVQLGHFAERRRAERRLADETVALAAVARATRRLTDAVEVGAAREAICDAAREVTGATCAFLALPEPPDDPGASPVVRTVSPPGESLEVVARRFPADAQGALLRAFATGRAAFVYDAATDPGAAASRDARGAVALGLLQPILHGERTLGVLGVGWSGRRGSLDRSARLLVRLVADDAAMALSRVALVGRLETAARTDPLTGLANRRLWDEHLHRELAAAARDGRPVAVAMLDVDGLKAVNDDHGHQTGDRLLRTVAAAWEDQLRAGDLLARVGGDEFAALLVGCTLDVAVRLAQRLHAATPDATASVGVAAWDGVEAPAELMARADAALYAAKAAGRDRVVGR